MKTFKISEDTLRAIKDVTRKIVALLLDSDAFLPKKDKDNLENFSNNSERLCEALRYQDCLFIGEKKKIDENAVIINRLGKEFFNGLSFLTRSMYEVLENNINNGNFLDALFCFVALTELAEVKLNILLDAVMPVNPDKDYLQSIPFTISESRDFNLKLVKMSSLKVIPNRYQSDFAVLVDRVLVVNSKLATLGGMGGIVASSSSLGTSSASNSRETVSSNDDPTITTPPIAQVSERQIHLRFS